MRSHSSSRLFTEQYARSESGWSQNIKHLNQLEETVETKPKIQLPAKHRENVAIFLICGTAALVANIAVGSMPILIPIEVLRKDYRLAWIGILLLVYGFVVAFFEFFQLKIIPMIGVKRSFVLTCGLLGVCNFFFGLLDFTDNQIVFGSLGCLIRIPEAFCYAGLMNTIMTIFCLTWPESAVVTIGITDGLVGLGYAIGPLLSGALFQVADFTLPFVLFGVCLLLVAIWGHFGLPETSGYAHPDFSILRHLSTDLAFISCAFIILAMGIVIGFLEATLEVYLAKFDKGAVTEGAIFFAAWTAAAIGSPFWGWVLKKTGQDLLLLLLGPVIEILMFVIFGPFPGLEAISNLLGLSIACLLVITLTTSMSLLAAIDIMLRQADRYGIGNDIVSYTFISSIWLATLYLGEGLGGIISGTVLDLKGTYSNVAVSLVGIQAILGTTAAIIMYFSWKSGNHGSNGIVMNMNTSPRRSPKNSYEILP